MSSIQSVSGQPVVAFEPLGLDRRLEVDVQLDLRVRQCSCVSPFESVWPA
jgi:hypothetical protein